MKDRFTPGPWNRGVAQMIYQGERWDPRNQQRLIAICEPTTRTQSDWEQTWANADLIAASPQLLDALRNSVKSLEWAASVIGDIPANSEYMQSLQEARDIIAKATGGQP